MLFQSRATLYPTLKGWTDMINSIVACRAVPLVCIKEHALVSMQLLEVFKLDLSSLATDLEWVEELRGDPALITREEMESLLKILLSECGAEVLGGQLDYHEVLELLKTQLKPN